MASKVVDTGTEGWQACRDSVRARLKRSLDRYKRTMQPAAAAAIALELEWLDGQAKRAASRPGGVERAGGRKGKGGGR